MNTRVECDGFGTGILDCPDFLSYNTLTGTVTLATVDSSDAAGYALAIQEEGTYDMAIRTAASSDPFTASLASFTVYAVDC